MTDENTTRFSRLRHLFSAPITEVYLLFYQSALQTFVHFNMFLQREDSLIPVIFKQMVTFLTKLAGKFVLTSAINTARGNFLSLTYKESESQLPGNII